VDGALRAIFCHGVAKTTLDDVARAAGCSRATVYRAFPGGKDAVMTAVVDTELARFFSEVAVSMGAAADLEDALVAGMSTATMRLAGHEALRFLLDHEPEMVVPHLAFEHHGEILATAARFAAPFLGRWLPQDEALRVAEWASRIVLSYLASPADGVDLGTDQGARHVVRTFVLPGVGVSAPEASVEADPEVSRSNHHVPAAGPLVNKGEAS